RVLDAGDTADFYAGAEHGGSVTSGGSLHSAGYRGPMKVSPCGGAVTPPTSRLRAQQFRDPIDRPLAAPDFQQRAHDVAHHVVQECIGFDLDDHLLAFAMHTDGDDVAARV